MPELPEVETLRRELSSAVKGKIIKSVKVHWPKMVKPLSVRSFHEILKDKKILGVNRRAKILILKLSDNKFLLIHLKLTGQLIYQKNIKILKHKNNLVVGGHPQLGGLDNLPNKYTHIIINFKDKSTLFFNDLRKFGWMRIVDKSVIDNFSKELGIEPFENSFTFNKFKEILLRYPNRKIKQVLLDQKLIAGIGNIYADESCFCAKIKPTRIIKSLKEKEIKDLRLCIIKILKLSISKKGTSSKTYIQLNGQPGGFVPYLKVYGRKGKKCKRCSGIIERIKINGRGTHFCKKCQK